MGFKKFKIYLLIQEYGRLYNGSWMCCLWNYWFKQRTNGNNLTPCFLFPNNNVKASYHTIKFDRYVILNVSVIHIQIDGQIFK